MTMGFISIMGCFSGNDAHVVKKIFAGRKGSGS